MIDRQMIAAMTVGYGVHTADEVETMLNTAEQTAHDVAVRMMRRELPAGWTEFLVDALVAAQFVAHAIDAEHDLDGISPPYELLRQIGDTAARSAVADTWDLVDVEDPRIWT